MKNFLITSRQNSAQDTNKLSCNICLGFINIKLDPDSTWGGMKVASRYSSVLKSCSEFLCTGHFYCDAHMLWDLNLYLLVSD